MAGVEDVVIAGGTEMMSSFKANASRNRLPFMDNGNLHLRALHPQTNQGVAADAIATLEGIDRRAVDELAAESQRRAEVAIKEGRFDKSLVPVRHPDGSIALDREEFPRPGTTVESLASLPPSFAALADMPLEDDGVTYRAMILAKFPGLEIDHVHHAGNSSGVVDGAAAILVTSPEYASAHGLKPRARVVALANIGDDPTLMLNAPVPAARKVLAKAGLALSTTSTSSRSTRRSRSSPRSSSATSTSTARRSTSTAARSRLGHPIGATGSMLIGTALDELERRDGQFALITMCAGGGMAPAIIIERV